MGLGSRHDPKPRTAPPRGPTRHTSGAPARRLSSLPCLGCGWCCLHDQCPESHILHGYLARCPEIAWDATLGLYRCRLASQKKFRDLLGMGHGCCAPLNPWREEVRDRDGDGDGDGERSGEGPFVNKGSLPRTPSS